MFRNFLKTAWRNLWKNKFYSSINVFGLAVGLTTGIMLLLWVQNEFSYDKFHTKAANIYRISSEFQIEGEPVTWSNVPGPLAVQAKRIPEVRSLVRIQKNSDQVLQTADKKVGFDGNTTASVDSNFFKIFDFEFLYGNTASALPGINSVVLTASTAKKLFATTNVLGKIIHYYDTDFTISGVLKDFPENSSLKYDAIFPMAFYAKQFTSWGGNGDWKTIDEDLGNYAFETFVHLQPGTDPEKVGEAFTKTYTEARDGDSDAKFKLQALEEMHLVAADGNTAALRMVQIFLLVVILLLAIASINYVNLSTARALVRAREISIRKIVGADKRQLFFQFLFETVLLFFFALILSLAMIFILMPLYNDISGKQLNFSLANIGVWKAIFLATIGTLAASSIYPAMLLSSFNPIASIKGKFAESFSSVALRRGLVVFQFIISISLLVCTIIMSRQMDFIRHKDLGFDKNYVFSVPLPGEAKTHLSAIRAELSRHPEIMATGVCNAYNINDMGSATSDISWQGKPKDNNMIISQLFIDSGFLPTMKISFIEGSNFTGLPADSGYYILNESAVKKIGLQKPYVGQPISFHDRPGVVHGVVKDFHYQTMKESIKPLLMYSFWDNGNILYVRTRAAVAQKAIQLTKKQYLQYAGDTPFNYAFVDEAFDDMYKAEQRSGLLFNLFAGIAIFISCLGLFGLATYMAEQRTKEFGIRKVLGASVAHVVAIMCTGFVKLVAIAFAIAIPLSWWAMHSWLNDFVYRTSLSWWVFAGAGICALIIALITVSLQAIRAAVANPVKSLRSE